MSEEEFAARVLSALVREGYVRWPVEGARVERDGFLAEDRISSGVGLARLRELVRQAAEPGDDVETFERECREALEAERAALPPVRPGEGRDDALAARLRDRHLPFNDDGRTVTATDPWGTAVAVSLTNATTEEVLNS